MNNFTVKKTEMRHHKKSNPVRCAPHSLIHTTVARCRIFHCGSGRCVECTHSRTGGYLKMVWKSLSHFISRSRCLCTSASTSTSSSLVPSPVWSLSELQLQNTSNHIINDSNVSLHSLSSLTPSLST